jgi:glycosyltransferase involved in cell wall biosynthesis
VAGKGYLMPDTKHSSGLQKPQSLSGRYIVAVTYSLYPADPRVRRAAEALVYEGATVEVVCLREGAEEPLRDTFHGVAITRVPLSRRRGGKRSYIARYGAFILLAGIILARRTIRRRPDVVHIHNMPDVLVFSALVPKILGSKIIIDLHDPMPELMQTIFGLRKESWLVRLLKTLEKFSIGFADRVITVNRRMKRLFANRSCSPEKVTVVMNSPDEKIFPDRGQAEQPAADRRKEDRFVVMYHGTIVERHGLDLVVRALPETKRMIPGLELRIYGSATPFLEEVMRLVQLLELSDLVHYFGPKSLEEISHAILECDVGIIPNRTNEFTELNMPTRIFEYLSQGKPVIAPKTSGILEYFDSTELVLFEEANSDELAAKIGYAFWHPTQMAEMVRRGQEVYRGHKWSAERLRFLGLVQETVKGKERPSGRAGSLPDNVRMAGSRSGPS